MDVFNFEWKPEYRGTWKCPSCGNEIWGTLKIGQSDIILELICKSCHKIEGSHLESITGRIDSLDANNVLNVMLCNLSLVKMKVSLGDGYNTYKYVAEEIFVSSEIDTLSLPIKTVRFCSEYIGLWSKGYIEGHITESSDEHRINLDYTQPEPYCCYEDDSILVELYYDFGSKTPNHSGYTLRTRHYLDVSFKEPSVDFHTAKVKAFQVSNLFSLLIQRSINFGDIIYITDKGTFIHHNASKFRNIIVRETPYTSNNFKDLTSDNLSSMVSKWRSYYQKYTNSLDSFFEIWHHELLPSEQRFKGYMSVIDGLTNDIPVEYEENLSKKEIIVKQYWPTFKEHLKQCDEVSARDLHKFDMAINGKKKKQDIPLEKRFVKLLEIQESSLPRNIDIAFVKKCVRTRHKLTHPESKYKSVFSPSQYSKVILNLETILCSYMLHCVGLEKDLIKQTLRIDDTHRR